MQKTALKGHPYAEDGPKGAIHIRHANLEIGIIMTTARAAMRCCNAPRHPMKGATMNRTVRLWLLFVILVAMGGIYLYQRELTTQCERNKAMQAAVEHTKAGMARAAMR